MKINVNAALFAAVRTAMSKEETRYYLRGVFVEPHPYGGVLLVATDGHRLGIAHDPEGSIDCNPVAFNVDINDRHMRNTLKKSNQRLCVTDAVAELTLDGTVMATGMVSLPGGEYPEYHRVLPKMLGTATEFKHGWNGVYISAISDAYSMVAPRKSTPIAFRGDGVGNPTWIISPSVRDLAFVLMPMRLGAYDDVSLGWISAFMDHKNNPVQQAA